MVQVGLNLSTAQAVCKHAVSGKSGDPFMIGELQSVTRGASLSLP